MKVSNPVKVEKVDGYSCNQLYIPLIRLTTGQPGGPVQLLAQLQKVAENNGVWTIPPKCTAGCFGSLLIDDLNALIGEDPDITNWVTSIMKKIKEIAERRGVI
jgi:hypothetical protein